MAGFRLLRRARADLLDIGAFTADRWGDDQAERYLVGLFAGFQTLVDRQSYGGRFARSLPTSAPSSASMPSSTESHRTARS
jgi:plasmid stabilization system protein ParE